MLNLPFELLEDILCRLPVKPLKCFRCVAKSWRALIDSEMFVKLHLRRSVDTNSHSRLIVAGEEDKIFKVDLDSEELVSAMVSVIQPPFSNKGRFTNPCNGLVLVLSEPLIIWNPFTTEYKKLPRIKDNELPVPLGCYSSIVCGFVWDSKNDDYKVVRVVEHRVLVINILISSRAHIYGLKSNTWKQIENFTYAVEEWHANLNGALHTLVFDFNAANQGSSPAKIMALSFENESHYEVEFPPLGDVWETGVLGMSLQKLGGCLSLSHVDKFGIAIWVMKDYGVGASWTKMFSIPMKIVQLAESAMKPLVYTKDGYKVLVWFGYNTFFELDLRTQTINMVPFEELPYIINHVEACFESLVSVRSEQLRNQGTGQDNKKKIRKIRDGFRVTRFKLGR